LISIYFGLREGHGLRLRVLKVELEDEHFSAQVLDVLPCHMLV
jgi:hypothetical protein